MKKFKHKKTGNVAEKRGDIYYFPNSWGGSYLPKDFIENTKDWEEVVKKDFEILSLSDKRNQFPIFNLISGCSPVTGALHPEINLSDWNIHSIKRLSDSEIFTVGDDVISKNCAVPNKILSIELINDKIRLYPRNSYYNLEDVRKVKQKLFITEDGVEIFEGDTVWHINLNTNKEPYSSIVKYTEPFTPVRELFSTKEKAEEYIKLNEPKYSLKDVKNAMTGDWFKTIEGNIVKDIILIYLEVNKNESKQ